MGRKLVLISYTPLGSSGGVPRWNRDIKLAFPDAVHYSWWDVCKDQKWDPNRQDIPEWTKAQLLNQWLVWSKRISCDDVIIADSFWGSGLETFPGLISLQHGNWSHTTKDDVERGVPPEFPDHAKAQLEFRKRYVDAGRKLVACSLFIAEQMQLQWGFESTVINNGIDTSKFVPTDDRRKRDRPLIVHFTTTQNKGLDHIRLLKRELDADVLLLDEAGEFMKMPKYRALAQADLVVHPSAHEGNSYSVAESLSSGIPVVSYDVGLLWQTKRDGRDFSVGEIIDRRDRCPERTVKGARNLIERISQKDSLLDPRNYITDFSLERFHSEWKRYLAENHRYSI